MVKKYKNRPIIIEAIQFTGLDNGGLSPKTVDFLGDDAAVPASQGDDVRIIITTLHGIMTARIGDYIVKNADGDFYPLQEEAFRRTYEPVE